MSGIVVTYNIHFKNSWLEYVCMYVCMYIYIYCASFKRQSAYSLTGNVYCYWNHGPFQLCDENPGSFSRANMYIISLRNYMVSLKNTWVQIMTFIFLVKNYTFMILHKCFQLNLFFDNDTQTCTHAYTCIHTHTHPYIYKAFRFSFL